MPNMKNRISERGNALFLILIATVMFGMLSYVVTQMMRGGEGGALQQSESRSLEGAEILQFTNAMRRAVQGMQIDGIPDTQVSFKGIDAVAGYTNPSCSVEACDVFLKGGGGLSYPTPEAKWRMGGHEADPWIFTGANAVTNVGTAAADLVVILPYIKKALCLKLNTQLGITNPADDAPQIVGTPNFAVPFVGTYAGSPSPIGGVAQINGQRSGCFRGAGTPPADTYHYYSVLISR